MTILFNIQMILLVVAISVLSFGVYLGRYEAELDQTTIMQSRIIKLNKQMDKLLILIKENDISSQENTNKNYSINPITELHHSIDLIRIVMSSMKSKSSDGLNYKETIELYAFMERVTLFMEKVANMFKYKVISKSLYIKK